VKLSALHPRYSRLQRERVMAELLPRLTALAVLARGYDIGLNIDAEEAERLELSLDLLEALCFEPALTSWNGVGFVVQAYQKRAVLVIDWLIDLARRSHRRLMVRLVKGAYWDSEIKRAQQDGLEGFPVFTRKVHTDVSYIACARRLLGALDAVFPQFATHNAYTVAAVRSMAGDSFQFGQYEFQCLHGMGEPLYEEVLRDPRLSRPVRIYAPVGTHETLLAYLVRRLLENGANTSFVNRIQNPDITLDELADDPVARVAVSLPIGAPHERIRLPRDLFGAERPNSSGLDLSNEDRLRTLAPLLAASAAVPWKASPDGEAKGQAQPIRNPADHRDVVGHVVEASVDEVDSTLARASAASDNWRAVPAKDRAAILLKAADLLEDRMQSLLGLIVREAGKSLSNAISEVREAVDFLRYYAGQVRDGFDNATHQPLGPVVCISPWNFPLAIFTGQVVAALAAGNTVLAKPAEETPLIAAQAVAVLHEAGVPVDVLQLVTGAGEVGARLVGDPRTRGGLFTGSTDVARLIQRQLVARLNPDGSPVPLVAETGGQNALIVDSSALAEQVVADALMSAFDSAGQRCSALRVLCLQDDIADPMLAMLKGALQELTVGNPDRLSTDVGPVISAEARDAIQAHIEAMRAAGRPVHQAKLPADCAHGTFVAPTIIEIDSMHALKREVFGPVLHVLRFRRDALDALIDDINATGYGLTFGIHTRISETAERASARVAAGNTYINRNVIGAVVGVQPFGGHGLSGTGPKAGGPLYLRRLLSRCPDDKAPVDVERVLPGPVGEENLYRTEPRGTVLCVARSPEELVRQIGAAHATGNRALVARGQSSSLPPTLANSIATTDDPRKATFDVVLFDGTPDDLKRLARDIAARKGPLVSIHVAGADGRYPLEWLVRERSQSTNTAAAGGNANLMMIG
jgi:RHH-type proline utilization regulon transcriptional repressor/proline dehydrogenase/delta 1-pyrroline-5-carboxylate dehydrogenase